MAGKSRIVLTAHLCKRKRAENLGPSAGAGPVSADNTWAVLDMSVHFKEYLDGNAAWLGALEEQVLAQVPGALERNLALKRQRLARRAPRTDNWGYLYV